MKACIFYLPFYTACFALLLGCGGINEATNRNIAQVQRQADSLAAVALLDSLYGPSDTVQVDSVLPAVAVDPVSPPQPIPLPQNPQPITPKTLSQKQPKPPASQVDTQAAPPAKATEVKPDSQRVAPTPPTDTILVPPPSQKPAKPDTVPQPVAPPEDTSKTSGTSQ